MYKTILRLFLFLLPSISLAQYNLDFGGGLSLTNYLGEMGGKGDPRKNFILDLRSPQNSFGACGFVRYKFNPLISVKGALCYTSIKGADANSTYAPRVARNLSFTNNIFELDLTTQIFFYEIPALYQSIKHSTDFRAYVTAGVGVFHHNPKAEYQGVKYALQPLQTEGVPYSLVGVCIPMGIGAFFTFDRKYRVGFEICYRKTFTDYLDDVSDRYTDPSTQTPLAAALGNRTAELVSSDPEIIELQSYNYGWNTGPQTGALRGEVKHKDGYLTLFEAQFAYVIRGKSSFYRTRYPGLFGNKSKKRRIRAKF